MCKIFLSAFLGISASLFASGVLPLDGLVAYYPFNGSFENEFVQDSIKILATENYGAKFALDRFEKENAAAYFDGNGSYLEIPDNGFSVSEQKR